MGPNGLSPLIARARGRTKRAWVVAPVVRQWSEARYLMQLGRHAENLPWLTHDRYEILEQLRREGVVQLDATAMIPGEVLDAADRFVARLQISTSLNRSVYFSPDELASEPVLFKWGLTEENLDLAENYIGLPVHYRGVDVKRERADGIASHVRQWHMDAEDRRMLKVIVYLSDVDDGCGPFEYIDPARSALAARALHYSSGFVSDVAMDRIVPAESWLRVTGPRLWATLVATTRVFHRARPPTTTDRYSMTFSYSSATPYQVFPQYMLSRPTQRRLRDELTPRQRRASMID